MTLEDVPFFITVDHFEWLRFNFTQAVHQSHSCSASCDASNSQAVAAMSQMQACESSKHYMMTQMWVYSSSYVKMYINTKNLTKNCICAVDTSIPLIVQFHFH